MVIQYASDLHLEFAENRDLLNKRPIDPKGDILILAGDIVPFALMYKYQYFFDYVSEHFRTTYWIPGNHEYYHSDLADRCGTFKEDIRPNVHLLNNYRTEEEGVTLIFSTMWTKISSAYEWDIANTMNDFKIIEYKGRRLTPAIYNQLHEESVNFISSELHSRKGESIVVTHHVPTYFNYPTYYKGSPLNEAFAVELSNLIQSYGPDFWIYGHHHSNIPYFTPGRTGLITNQLGYVFNEEHDEFDEGKVFNCQKWNLES